jgi:hypothetical protein
MTDQWRFQPLPRLLNRTKAACQATAKHCRNRAEGEDKLTADALEGFAGQLDDRAAQCEAWLFSVDRWGDRIGPAREAEIRESCAEWLRMAK